MVVKTEIYFATRKTANAHVYITKGVGKVRVNNVPIDMIEPEMAREVILVPLEISGEIRKVINSARATIGTVSNSDHQNILIGKAGRNRWKGKRPSVRGVAMNPVDHPHGGGEGKTSGGRSPVSPWGQSAKGLKTRKNKTTNKYIILRRKKRR